MNPCLSNLLASFSIFYNLESLEIRYTVIDMISYPKNTTNIMLKLFRKLEASFIYLKL